MADSGRDIPFQTAIDKELADQLEACSALLPLAKMVWVSSSSPSNSVMFRTLSDGLYNFLASGWVFLKCFLDSVWGKEMGGIEKKVISILCQRSF